MSAPLGTPPNARNKTFESIHLFLGKNLNILVGDQQSAVLSHSCILICLTEFSVFLLILIYQKKLQKDSTDGTDVVISGIKGETEKQKEALPGLRGKRWFFFFFALFSGRAA
jgi:hypothetical protein